MGLFGVDDAVFQEIFQTTFLALRDKQNADNEIWNEISELITNTLMFHCFVAAIKLVDAFPKDVTVPLRAKQYANFLKNRFQEVYDESFPKGDIEEMIGSYLSGYLLCLKTDRSSREDILKEMIGRYLKSCDLHVDDDNVNEIYEQIK